MIQAATTATMPGIGAGALRQPQGGGQVLGAEGPPSARRRVQRAARALGIRRDGKHVPLDKMNLPEASSRCARPRRGPGRARVALRRDARAGYDNVIRELTYTLLNRLVGLKAMEVRRLLYLPPPGQPMGAPEETEVITPSLARRDRDSCATSAQQEGAATSTKTTQKRRCSATALPPRSVTSRTTSGSSLIPITNMRASGPHTPRSAKVLELINDGLPADAYRAQDFLGWVYQFFNREEKKTGSRREQRHATVLL